MTIEKALLSTMTVVFLALPTAAHAQSTANQEMRSALFLVGTWKCADTVGEYSGSYTLTVTRALDERWLRQQYQWHSSDRPRPLSGEYFLGFDPRVKKWIRMGAMNDGMYFGMVGTRDGNVWTYGYVLPGTKGTAVYTKLSDNDYKVLGPSYPEGGKQMTEHHGCHKSS